VRSGKSVIFTAGQKVPVKIWAAQEEVELAAIGQLTNIASLPFVFKHVAAMPDVHLGIGATVGSVVATKNAIIPAAVGVDIGCGMMAARITNIDPRRIIDKVVGIRSAIEAVVPVGHKANADISDLAMNWRGWKHWEELHATKIHKRAETDLFQRAMSQLGTLGGGNHFIELCTDLEGQVWIMLHSGSRNIGKSIAEIHINNAKDTMRKMFITLPDPDLAYYVENTTDYTEYMLDLGWAQNYALKNREMMFVKIVDAIRGVVCNGEALTYDNVTNCHHNYASRENHYGENVIITRKGAVRARAGERGIIPGSMGAKSFIVEGLGNAESFHSCSHGAGRKMSRTEARKTFTLEDLAAQTSGVECRKDIDVIDEIPAAYKCIDTVMENQKDLVKIVAQLKQFMCIKG